MQEEEDSEVTTTEPINVSVATETKPKPTDKIKLGFTTKFKSPHNFMKSIQDDGIRTILKNTIHNPREKREIKLTSTYNLRYRIFDKLDNDDKLKLASYLLGSLTT